MGRKLKFVLSDLHLGAGYNQNRDNPLEDFTATAEFANLLHEIAQESLEYNREIELIINGDLFEFLQVPAVDDYDPTISYSIEAYLDSSETASIKRLNIIAEGHREIFYALSDFMHVESPQRHITIIKGNHDVSLFWPGVKGRLREILGASGARASLLRFADEFVNRERIYIEHGHQQAEKMNGYHDSFDPRSSEDQSQLYYPAGSRFVINFFNQVERKQQFVDQIKPITTLIWYAFHWDFNFASKALACFIRYLPALVINRLDTQPGMLFRTDHLLHNLENEQRRQEIWQQYRQDKAFRQKFHQQVQQYLDDTVTDSKGTPNQSSSEISDNPLEMGRINQQQQRRMLRRAAERIADQEKAKVILFGHTHESVQQQLNNNCLYINTGCWIRDFSKTSPQIWEALFNGSHKYHEGPHALPYARIDYDDEDNPHAQLLYFKDPTGETASTVSEPAVEIRVEVENIFEKGFQWLFRLLGNNNI